jgi:Carboxypeptidase regulatory-like domain
MVEGGEAQMSPRPQPRASVVAHEGDLHGPTVARTQTDPSGAFQIDLPPGTYTVASNGLSKTVTVKPGSYVTVTLVMEMK